MSSDPKKNNKGKPKKPDKEDHFSFEKEVKPPTAAQYKKLKHLLPLEEVTFEAKFQPVSVLAHDEVEITYYCKHCKCVGKAFCRRPPDKVYLFDRVTRAIRIAHAMKDLLACDNDEFDVRLVDCNGELI